MTGFWNVFVKREDDGHVIKAEIIDMDIPSSPPKGIKGHSVNYLIRFSKIRHILMLIYYTRYDSTFHGFIFTSTVRCVDCRNISC